MWVHVRTDMGACEDRYGCQLGPIWVQVGTDMGAHEDRYECT